MCGPLRFLVIRAIYIIWLFLMIILTMCGRLLYDGSRMHSPLCRPFTPMSACSLGVPSFLFRLTMEKSSTTLLFALFYRTTAQFFVSHARTLHSRTVEPNASFAL